MELIEIVIILEIILVNNITVARCCHRNYSRPISLIALAAFTVALFGLGYFFMSKLPFYGNGNGLFILFGFFYLIPLVFLYKETISQLFIVICLAWVYTLGVFALSVQIGKVLDPQSFYRNVLLIESSIFLLSIVPFKKIIVKQYTYILKKAKEQGNEWGRYLAITSTMHFFTMLGANLVFSLEDGSWVKVLVITLLLLTMFFMYIILSQMIRQTEKADVMHRTAYHDNLTGLKNRLSLLHDLQELLQSDTVFTFFFMDLDNFKKVNDDYGHVKGDKYLQHFSNITRKTIGENGCLYRFGGDEFAAIVDGIASDDLIQEIQKCEQWEIDAPCPFHSVSIGTQKCEPPHMAIEDLLEQTDYAMYVQKKRIPYWVMTDSVKKTIDQAPTNT